jgi:hypothetical protein
MNFEGNLSSLFLPNVLQLINKEGTNGILRIFGNGYNLSIYIENGEIVYAEGIDKEEQLLNLMRKKKIAPDTLLQRAQEIKEMDPYALGSFLLAQKLISLKAWQAFLKLKVEQVLLRAFLAEAADFKFSTETFNLPKEYKADINMMQLLLDITRKIDEWNYIKKHIPDRNIIFEPCKGLADDSEVIQFNRAEWSIFSKIDGKKSTAEIMAESELGELQVLKILYSLLSSGLIKRLENQYINGEWNFVDYEAIISLYIDLFQVLKKNLQTEIGREFYRIFEKCLKALGSDDGTLLNGFSPFSGDIQQNIQLIVPRLGKYSCFNEAKEALLLAFNHFIKAVLENIEIIVGPKVVEKTLNEVYMAVYLVGTSQHQNSDINELVSKTLKQSLGGNPIGS